MQLAWLLHKTSLLREILNKIRQFVPQILIRWIVIYPVDSAFQLKAWGNSHLCEIVSTCLDLISLRFFYWSAIIRLDSESRKERGLISRIAGGYRANEIIGKSS